MIIEEDNSSMKASESDLLFIKKMQDTSHGYEDWDKEHKKQIGKTEVKKMEDDRVSKKTWSVFVMIYLLIFTFLLFVTLWGNYSRFHLTNVTLHILITAGFIKVVSLSFTVVNHFYLLPKKAKVKSDV